MTFAVIFAVSLVAVLALVALAAWARIARPLAPLDVDSARAAMAEEFPGEAVTDIWLAADGLGAIGRAGERAVVLFRVGDGYVARRIAWRAAMQGVCSGGRLILTGADAATPPIRLAMGDGAWPPAEAVT